MKTLVFRNTDNSTRVEVKVDLFATDQEILVPGFDTKFTAMHIEDDDAAIILGINVNELDYSFASLVAMAQGLDGVGLFSIDLNENNPVAVQAQVDSVALAGGSGTANINVDTVNYLATFNTDLATTADDFVTTHAAALSSAGITVTHPNADGVLVFTADVAGVAFKIESDIANVSGDLDGTLSNTTLNQSGAGEVTIVAP